MCNLVRFWGGSLRILNLFGIDHVMNQIRRNHFSKNQTLKLSFIRSLLVFWLFIFIQKVLETRDQMLYVTRRRLYTRFLSLLWSSLWGKLLRGDECSSHSVTDCSVLTSQLCILYELFLWGTWGLCLLLWVFYCFK
jgi:hypothetical protein